MTTVLQIENLAKQYRLGSVSAGSLSSDAQRLFARIRGKEDPFLLVGEENDRTKSSHSEYVWALNEVSFEVKQGEILGIIGKNGAGKSTLLKILSQITAPTKGSVKIRGKIASLLEIGTGFHPELTGKENIFLNGAILGMSRQEITKKFDEIVSFAGVQRYLDTPIKRYSSGMKVRLGFAVAAHLEPEILIIDEVLAVGDSEFQKKCLGKINDISKNQGRTVLFVSHNMGAISSLCDRAIYLKNGRLIADGPTKKIISQYLESESKAGQLVLSPLNHKPAYVESITCRNGNHENLDEYDLNDDIFIEVVYRVQESLKGLVIAFILENEKDSLFYTFNNEADHAIYDFEMGRYKSTHKIPKLFLKTGSYYITINIGRQSELIQGLSNAVSFKVVSNSMDITNKGFREDRPGIVITPGLWINERI